MFCFTQKAMKKGTCFIFVAPYTFGTSVDGEEYPRRLGRENLLIGWKGEQGKSKNMAPELDWRMK